jgi:hypothetical protein
MTQELIANMLGVRREGVTEAARPKTATRGTHPIPARPHHGVGSRGTREPHLRMLRCRQKRIRSAASLADWDLAVDSERRRRYRYRKPNRVRAHER